MKLATLALAAALTMLAAPSHAALAFLVSCRTGTSVTGQFVYVGTYNYAGRYFTQVFTSWCPQSLEVF